MARGKLESGQQKNSPKDISSRVESDLVELVWENGQLLMQGQSSRTTRTSTVHSLPSNSPRFRDAGVGNSTVSRIGKFGEIETVLDDISPVISSGELDMSQDDVIAPWLNFPLEDTMPHDYCSEVLPEISGVTANEISVQHSIVSVDKSCSDNHTVSNLHGTGIGLKGLSSKARLPNWPPLQGQASDSSLGSRFSDVISNSSSLQPVILSGNSAQDRNLTNDSASMKMEWPNFKLPNNNVLNFSHFSRPTFLVKTKTRIYDALPTAVSSGVETMEDQDKVSVSSSVLDERLSSSLKGISFHVQPAICVMGNSTNIAEAPKKAVPAEITEKVCQIPPIKNDNPIVQSTSSSMMKEVGDSKNIIESMVASSSVGSDNCTDTVSCEKRHKNKRKFLDIEESDCHSDGVQTEGVGAKRAASVGGTGSKRSRAAEVHNLSERRRRDRINEKMRALQELIPNCNKADKASMLDEAIEYLKTLQLQVQIMSMGTGLYVPPVMFPPGIQHMHPPHIPYFSPMGMSMGMAMGYGTSMLDMNGGRTLGFPIFPVPPMQAAQFPHPMSGPSHFPGIPGHNFAVYGFPSQGIQNSGPRVPLIPLSRPPMDSAMGFSNSRIGKHDEELRTSSNLKSGNPLTHNNCQIMGNAEVSCSRNTESTQLPTKTNVLDKPSVVQDNEQPTDGGGHCILPQLP